MRKNSIGDYLLQQNDKGFLKIFICTDDPPGRLYIWLKNNTFASFASLR